MYDFNAHIKKFIGRLLLQSEIAIDLGTSNTRIGIREKGIVLREPTYIGLNTKTDQYLFFGEEAKEVYGKSPNFVRVSKPVEHAIISNFDATVLLLKNFLEKSVTNYFSKTQIIKSQLTALTTTPTTSTEVEQKALIEALIKTSINRVLLIEKPLATALGAGLPIFSKNPCFIIDMGGGLIEIAVIIMGGIVVYKTLPFGGEQMDRLIINYLHLKNGIVIGEQTAEILKITLFNLQDKPEVMTVRGKSLENGLPKSIRVKSSEIAEALMGSVNQVIDSIKELMETIPPEIIDGIIKSGLTLTGGIANIAGMDKYLMNELKIPVSVPENPQDSTIKGSLALLIRKQQLEKILIK